MRAERKPHSEATVVPLQPRVVGGTGEATAKKRLLKDQFLRDWKSVKAARFNAAKRLERKQSASITTLAVVAFYTGSICLFTLTFKDGLADYARSVLEFVSQFFGFFTLIIGLIEQQKDYPGRARELHDCALKINAVSKQLQAATIAWDDQLQPYLRTYDEAIAGCRVNHDDIDYELAEARRRQEEVGGKRRLQLARMWYHFATYWLYVLIWVAPLIVTAGLLAWAPELGGAIKPGR